MNAQNMNFGHTQTNYTATPALVYTPVLETPPNRAATVFYAPNIYAHTPKGADGALCRGDGGRGASMILNRRVKWRVQRCISALGTEDETAYSAIRRVQRTRACFVRCAKVLYVN